VVKKSKIDKNTLVIEVSNLTKDISGLAILKGISFSLPEGTWISVTGPSGSGKTTLLSILAGLDRPTSGLVSLAGQSLSELTEEGLSHFRAQNLGFVFQNFRLVPTLTALENVQIPLEILNLPNSEDRAREMLIRVGLKARLEHLPSQLSGGEQQRVALARAFVSHPKILFADEPTGNLDTQNGKMVLELLEGLQKEHNSTLVVVTHDKDVASKGKIQIKMRDGKLE
jgi:putative ABC transport system ATP-binding protein